MKIETVQHAVPSRRVTNEDVLAMITRKNPQLNDSQLSDIRRKIKDLWRQTGTEIRRIRREEERALSFATNAGRAALDDAGLSPAEVDFLIYTGVSRGWLEPATAHVMQHELSLQNATSFDLMDACASWIRGMEVAYSLIRAGAYDTGMIINCEFNCREYGNFTLRDPDDLSELFATFTIGEAAAATIVSDDPSIDDYRFKLRTFGEYYDRCMIPLPNASQFTARPLDGNRPPLKFFSRSRELISFTTRKIVETYRADRSFRETDFDIVFGHAVSTRVGSMLCEQLNIPPDRYYSTHSAYGNTVSAAIPLAMSLAREENRLRRGMKTLLVMGSAGVTIGLASFTF